MLKLPGLFILFIFLNAFARAQKTDSSLQSLQELPSKYIKTIDKKVTLYTERISSKTEKTLTKLSYWENKIKALLARTSPATAERLFGNNQVTFTSLLQQVKNGEAIAVHAQAPYNTYRDNLTTSLQYLSQQKEQLDSGLIKKIKTTSSKMQQLNSEEDEVSAVQQFIKERKKLLFEQAYQQLGKSKYLLKISKESYYYTETLKNYKELLNDSKKAEETGKAILSKIPAFQHFVQKNSMLASMFGAPANSGGLVNIAGLQTRASMQGMIQNQLGAGGADAGGVFSQKLTQAKAMLAQLKDKLSSTTGSSVEEFPDFKPNLQKTKTFLQRLEYGTNFQITRNNKQSPNIADLALNLGYKFSDKISLGVGGAFKLGLGSIERIRFTGQGASARSYLDWKLHKQLFLSGGFEMNYLSALPVLLQPLQAWKKSGLIGITKKINIKTRWSKETKFQLLFDFLSQQHLPVTQPILFRVGYNF